MKAKWTFGLFLLLGLTVFQTPASAHWGGGDGHVSATIVEWGIILGSLIGTFVLIMRKKPIQEDTEPQETTIQS